MSKILVIEDDSVLQQAYKDKFERNGFQVICAVSGEEGIQTAAKEIPDLIILDIILVGNLTGEDVLKQIKLNPKISSIPVVIMTNLDDKMFKFYDMGANWYFVKATTTLEQVLNKIKEILNHN
ncbi:hypothetical protein A2W14_00445 [Candidatus Gottesmanbacteria bacterium RBG_16_37_8]|uniref:Response regulatory domain-containing protein n=1 Tax=Candidatus Gottesmanbacteria bacterium RBG_16_37_8 TaxID=1798371 RepID=A0A1F5YQL2_9BACT|nr:MAG: hypothetical protein A2W14_00445 [Candidatus Gottesmanbacteria bacterium RBG_16_37_8]